MRQEFETINSMRNTAGCLVISVFLVCQSSVRGECPYGWNAGSGAPGLSGSLAWVADSWDPDGPGPLEEWLVVGGSFWSAGGVLTNGIAFWDGQRWRSPQGGVSGSSSGGRVYTVESFEGHLIVAGGFSSAGGVSVNNVAAWNGVRWQALGAGLPGTVYALREFNGTLYAAGYLGPGEDGGGVFRWDGASWDVIGQTDERNTLPVALTVHNNMLVAGGGFRSINGVSAKNIARWNGQDWHALGEGITGADASVICLEVFNGDLYAGGFFDYAGGAESRGVARWDGTNWHDLNTESFPFYIPFVMRSFGDRLVVAGYFDCDPDPSGLRVCAWDGAEWGRVSGDPEAEVYAITGFRGDLVIGGASYGFSAPMQWLIAAQRGQEWAPLCDGPAGPVWKLTVFHDSIIFAGSFDYAGKSRVNAIARFRDGEWSGLGTGVSMGCSSGMKLTGPCGVSVDAMVVFEGDLIVSGRFLLADNLVVKNVARWDGTHWHNLGAGLNGLVYSLAVHNGRLYAGGYIPSSGETVINGVAEWDGSAWNPVGRGLSGNQPFVYAMYSHQGKLIAAGRNLLGTIANPVPIASWDGVSWEPVGSNLQGDPVLELGEFDGKLIAAGDVRIRGEAGPIPHVVEWNGGSWQRVGDGLRSPSDYAISFLMPLDDELLVGGWFTTPDGVTARNLARWDGSSWSQFGDGRTGSASAAVIFGQDFVCATGFTDTAAGVVSYAYSTWSRLGPTIVSMPASTSTCPGGVTSLYANAEAAGSEEYQWFRDGIELLDDGHFSGATTPTLTISESDLDDEGLYWIRVTDDCGTTQSPPALVSVPCCGARLDGDLNGDGDTNGLDLQFFLDRVLSGSGAASVVCAADFNYDRMLDVRDGRVLAELLTR